MSEIEQRLAGASTLVEMLAAAKRLKAGGADVAEVNNALAKRKKELLAQATDHVKLSKVFLPTFQMGAYLNSCLNVAHSKNQSPNVLEVTENGEFIL